MKRATGGLGDRQHGVVGVAQLRELGITERQILRAIESGYLERTHVGVFRIRGAAESYHQRLVAACLAIGPEAAASHRAAATLHSLLRYREPPVEVTTTRVRSPERDGVVAHRLADLHPRWVTAVDGVRVTTVARTLVDLGAVASPRTVEAALDRATGRRLLGYRELRDAMVAVARKGRRGVGTIRPLLQERLGRELPAGVLEARMASLLRRSGLPEPEAEHTVTDEHGGFVAVVDFAFVDRRLAIEADGHEFHSTPRAIAYGQARDALLRDSSWSVLHFTWHEIEREAPDVASRIHRELHHRPVFSAR